MGGLNECFRLAKYHPGHRFGAHVDAWFERSNDERSFYTLNLYTNTVAEEHGGRTRFFAEHERRRQPKENGVDLAVRPETGLAVLFQQPPADSLLHDGEELTGGVKYLLRTDVMYRRMR